MIMKRFFKLILPIFLAALTLSFSACDKGENSGSTPDSSSPTPPPAVEPVYKTEINLTTKDYGDAGGDISELIASAYQTVYSLTAISENAYTYGSAVAVFTLKVTEEKPDADSTTSVYTCFATCLNLLDGADEYVLTDVSGSEYEAKLIGGDPTTNLAVLAIKGEKPVASLLNDSDSIRIGDGIFTVGTPYNAGAPVYKVTTLGSPVHEVDLGLTRQRLMNLSEGLNRGYAGGAVYLSESGALCGLVTMPDGIETDGFTFVIPSNTVTNVCRELAETYVPNTSYGFISGKFFLGADYRIDYSNNVYVSELDASGSLALGGMMKGDIIARIGYVPAGSNAERSFVIVTGTADVDEFIKSLTDLKIGDALNFKIVRDDFVTTKRVEIKQYVYGEIKAESDEKEKK